MKNRQISVIVTQDQYLKLKLVALFDSMTVSDVLRRAIDAATVDIDLDEIYGTTQGDMEAGFSEKDVEGQELAGLEKAYSEYENQDSEYEDADDDGCPF